MDEVASIMACESISFAGMTAYSSTMRKEIAHRGQSLMNFFAKINQCGNARESLEGRLKEVFNMYDHAIQSDIDAICQQKLAINGLQLDALEIGGAELYEKIHQTIAKLDQKQDTVPLEKLLKELQRIFEAFTQAVRQTTAVLEEACWEPAKPASIISTDSFPAPCFDARGVQTVYF